MSVIYIIFLHDIQNYDIFILFWENKKLKKINVKL